MYEKARDSATVTTDVSSPWSALTSVSVVLTLTVRMVLRCPFCCEMFCAWFVRQMMKIMTARSVDAADMITNCASALSIEFDFPR